MQSGSRAGHRQGGTCWPIRRRGDHRLSGLSPGDRAVRCGQSSVRWRVQFFSDELGQVELPLDDLSLRMRDEAGARGHARLLAAPRHPRHDPRCGRSLGIRSRPLCRRGGLARRGHSLGRAPAMEPRPRSGGRAAGPPRHPTRPARRPPGPLRDRLAPRHPGHLRVRRRVARSSRRKTTNA